jgi:hypothetical protein
MRNRKKRAFFRRRSHSAPWLNFEALHRSLFPWWYR